MGVVHTVQESKKIEEAVDCGGYSRNDALSVLTREFTSSDLCGKLGGKTYHQLNFDFHFLPSFVYCGTGLLEQAPMTELHSMCADLTGSSTRYRCSEMTDDVRNEDSRWHENQFKWLLRPLSTATVKLSGYDRVSCAGSCSRWPQWFQCLKGQN